MIMNCAGCQKWVLFLQVPVPPPTASLAVTLTRTWTQILPVSPQALRRGGPKLPAALPSQPLPSQPGPAAVTLTNQ